MTALIPEDWDVPEITDYCPFRQFVEDEASLFRLREIGMPEEQIREIRQDQDEHLMELHVGLMQIARITGEDPPELFGWGDENFYSTTRPRESA